MNRILSFLIISICFSTILSAQNLRIYHIDVDQGDATLFVSPEGSSMLIDAGKNGHGDRIKRVMDIAGISRIDHFVATHYHEDHYGGIDDLIADHNIEVLNSYDRGDKDHLPQSKLNGSTYMDYDSLVGNRAIELSRGMTIQLGAEVRFICISKGGVVLGELNSTTGIDENDMSLSFLVEYGNFKYFIGGDIERPTELKIAELEVVPEVDVYQANHHGSYTSSSFAFLQDLHPNVVIISNGNNLRYGHPRRVTLDTLAMLNPPPTVFQTNKFTKNHADVQNVDDLLIADLIPEADEGTILLTVNLDSNSYDVDYRDQKKTFTIKNQNTGNPDIIIESILPNPVGSDLTNEQVTLHNRGSNNASLNGWILSDASGRIWQLNSIGDISANGSITISRKGMPMSLNNDGDIISLINSENRLVDKFQYISSREGHLVNTGH